MTALVEPMHTFQDAFVQALWADAPPASSSPAPRWHKHPGLAVYRNTGLQACAAALAANFPTVVQLTGDAWFQATAVAFARQNLPTDPCLLRYGDGFAEALLAGLPEHGLPYLPGVASLDALWREAHGAADARPFDAAALADANPEAVGRRVLTLHPACRWGFWPDAPVGTIWRCHREGLVVPEDLAWRGEGVVLTRPADAVAWQVVGPGCTAFLDACGSGESLAAAAERALSAEPGVDLTHLFHLLLRAGAFQTTEAMPS